jgi:hypothetical protein
VLLAMLAYAFLAVVRAKHAAGMADMGPPDAPSLTCSFR